MIKLFYIILIATHYVLVTCLWFGWREPTLMGAAVTAHTGVIMAAIVLLFQERKD